MNIPTRYDFQSIDDLVISGCINDLNTIYEKNLVKDNKQKYQTKDILFSEQNNPCWSEHWDVLKNTFLDSVSAHTKQTFSNCKAWCFGSFPKTKNLQWEWHTHPKAVYSGILYLTLPTDTVGNLCFTTEFLQPDRKSLFVEPIIGSWFIFDATWVHRNGFWDHQEMNDARYCIAASVF